MLTCEDICMKCGREQFSDWIDEHFKLVCVNRKDGKCVFSFDKDGEDVQIICHLGDDPSSCDYYLERLVLNEN